MTVIYFLINGLLSSDFWTSQEHFATSLIGSFPWNGITIQKSSFRELLNLWPFLIPEKLQDFQVKG
jgi:hypothetical protein